MNTELPLEQGWHRFLAAADRERAAAAERPVGHYPHFSDHGQWQLLDVDHRSSWQGETYEHGNWTAGFWHGVQWLRAIGDGDELAPEAAGWSDSASAPERSEQENPLSPEPGGGADRQAARAAAHTANKRVRDLEPRASDISTHDLGFLFYPSLVLGYRLGFLHQDAVASAHQAAGTLARRLNSEGDYLQAFGTIGDPQGAGTSTIDTMLNLPLLWWSAAEGGDPVLHQAARRHARTSARLYLRPDGSTFHLLRFDPTNGAVLDRGTFQGANSDSCWSRGQGWAVAGFAWAYAATGEVELLQAAERTAAHFLERMPAGRLPPWDFADTAPDAPRDASAAVIVALGAAILAQLHPTAERRAEFRGVGERLLRQVSASALRPDTDEDRDEGILRQSCYSKPHGLGLDGATGWGDFLVGLALALTLGKLSLSTALGFTPHPALTR